MPAFEALLTVQNHDSAVDRLRHRRQSLPERAEQAQRQAARAELEERLADARSRRDAVLREERRMEDEVASLEAKAKAVDQKMYSGTVSSPKELQAMQADIDQLKKHAGTVEDEALEVLEQREALDAEVAGLEAEAAEHDGALARLAGVIAEQEAEIDRELGVEVAARSEASAGIPVDVLKLYEQVRVSNRGTGAARLVGANCGACHLSLPATEVDRIRHLPPEEMVRCEHCSAILVR